MKQLIFGLCVIGLMSCGNNTDCCKKEIIIRSDTSSVDSVNVLLDSLEVYPLSAEEG